MKTIEQFYNEAKDNKDLQAAFAEAVENGTADEFLKDQQVDGTLQDLEAYGKSQVTMRELSDEELEQTAGGEIKWGPYGDEFIYDRIQFAFNIGDRVEVYNGWCFGTLTKRATIIDRKIEPDPTTRTYRPRYQVKYDNPSRVRGMTIETKWVDQNYLSY